MIEHGITLNRIIDTLNADRGHSEQVLEEYQRLLSRGRLEERAMRIALIWFLEQMREELDAAGSA